MRSDNILTREMVLILKGIAIILMITNHLYPILDWIYPENEYFSFYVGDKTIAAYVGGFGKICVSIFAFLSGVGFSYTFDRYSESQLKEFTRVQYRKLLVFLISYAVIFFSLYYPVVRLVLHQEVTALEILLNLTGIYPSIVKVAWYVRFYIALILSLPITFVLCKNSRTLKSDVFFVFACIFCAVFSKKCMPSLIKEFFEYYLIVVSGYIMTKYNVLNIIIDKIKRSIFVFMVPLAVLLMRGICKDLFYINMDVLYVPVLLISFVCILLRLNLYFLNKILVTLGTYSLELWFLHAIFFVGNRHIQRLAYWPKFAPLILIWVIVLLLPVAVGYKNLTSKITQFIIK